MVDKLIIVTCIFLGQVGDSSGSPYRNRKVSLILLTLWLFGNLFLMVNYYQGSIYSCLAVLLPPPTPRRVEELADSNIRMIAMNEYYKLDGTAHTYLQDIVIPQLIKSVGQKPEFIKFLAKFQAKLLSANDELVSQMYRKILNENSTRTHPLMVLFFFRDEFEAYVRFSRYWGNRHIARSTGDSPFRVIIFHVWNRNLFTPYLAKGLKRIQESGLTQMWHDMNSIVEVFSTRELLFARGKYFKAVQDLFGRVREQATFHEAKVVSLDLILPAFYICAIIISLGVAGFATENWKLLASWGKTVVKITKGLVRGICKVAKAWTIQNIFKVAVAMQLWKYTNREDES